ncbi:uncharacterized protein LOC123866249 [Maniola jurtina]|uniref:uncharacterized protein LOC123866249 n=1 Tax=Maniola jurtina TaxID=191418 RepID=UPI001E68D8A6|nr:uncharacterized protein LOC123866249 [Maniola jurtina]
MSSNLSSSLSVQYFRLTVVGHFGSHQAAIRLRAKSKGSVRATVPVQGLPKEFIFYSESTAAATSTGQCLLVTPRGTRESKSLVQCLCVPLEWMASEDARTLVEAVPAVAVAAAVSGAASGERAERACACAAWPPRRQPAPHEILRPKPRRPSNAALPHLGTPWDSNVPQCKYWSALGCSIFRDPLTVAFTPEPVTDDVQNHLRRD